MPVVDASVLVKLAAPQADTDLAAKAIASLAEIVPRTLLLGDAVEVSRKLDLSLFDCVYLAVSIERGSPVLTANARYAKRAIAAGYAANVQTLR